MDGFWENIRGLGMLSDIGLSWRGRHQKLRLAEHSAVSHFANVGSLLSRARGVRHGGSGNDTSSMMTVTTHPNRLVLYTYAAECQSILAVTIPYA